MLKVEKKVRLDYHQFHSSEKQTDVYMFFFNTAWTQSSDISVDILCKFKIKIQF